MFPFQSYSDRSAVRRALSFLPQNTSALDATTLKNARKALFGVANPFASPDTFTNNLTRVLSCLPLTGSEETFLRLCFCLDSPEDRGPGHDVSLASAELQRAGRRARQLALQQAQVSSRNARNDIDSFTRFGVGNRKTAFEHSQIALRFLVVAFNQHSDRFRAAKREIDQIRPRQQQSREEVATAPPSYEVLPVLSAAMAQQRLREMTGLTGVKEKLRDFEELTRRNVERARQGHRSALDRPNHCLFLGNPGTGKTEIARLLGSLLRGVGFLRRGHVVVARKQDLEGEFIGQTAIKTQQLMDEAKDGILFVDEAHQFSRSSFGREAIATIMLAMSQRPAPMLVVFATYPSEQQAFFAIDPGLQRRLPNVFTFPNYSDDELAEIVTSQARGEGFEIAGDVAHEVGRQIGRFRQQENFGNAGEVGNAITHAITANARRTAPANRAARNLGTRLVDRLTLEDFSNTFQREAQNSEISRQSHTSGPEVLEAVDASIARDRLANLVGLRDLKSEVARIVDYVSVERAEAELEGRSGAIEDSMHCCFFGNPGTGKTEVAKLMGALLKAAGLLERGHVVVCSKKDLEGEHVGSTSIKTAEVLRQARGGVLFVDEAHSLVDSFTGGSGYGKEAISTLMVEMNHRPMRTLIIFATYQAERERLFSSDPGLERRCVNKLIFPNYSNNELGEILKRKAEGQGYRIAPATIQIVAVRIGSRRNRPNFGNGGDVEEALRKAKMFRAQRLCTNHRSYAQSVRTQQSVDRTLLLEDFEERA